MGGSAVMPIRTVVAFCLFLNASFLWPCAAQAGAWPQKKDDLQVIISFKNTRADQDYNAQGEKIRRNRFSKRELSPYIEYGLSDKITLVGSMALTQEETSWLGSTISNRGLSRIEAGARFALGQWDDTYFSFQPLLIWHGAMNQSDPYGSQRGDVDGEFGITMGQNFELWGLQGFSDNLVGIRIKPASRLNEVKANLTIGLDFAGGRKIMVKSESYASFTRDTNAAPSQIQSNKLGLSFVQKLDKTVSMELSGMAAVSGRNTINEQTLGFALWYDF